MEKLDMQTANMADKNYEVLSKMFPNAITEAINDNGEVVRAIDADILRQEISCEVVEGKEERYQFTWPDKKNAIICANTPITHTLRLDHNKSVSKDGSCKGIDSENIYIEGDNLDVLKLLRETYLGKIKMIYIDPPYNTGNDFIYIDDYRMTKDEWNEESGDYDEIGNRMTRNIDTNGRFHSDWCSMIYPRLVLSRSLLTEDGMIFISIDDNEVDNLKKICSEIYGAGNFIGEFVWEKMYTTKNDASFVSNSHEYILCYAKNYNTCCFGTLPRTDEMNARYTNPDNDPRGPWKAIPLYAKGESKNGRFPVVSPITGKEHFPPVDSHWRYAQNTIEQMLKENRIYFGKDGDALPNSKRFLNEITGGTKVKSLWPYEDVGSNDSAKKEMRQLFDEGDLFPFPKPTTLIYRCLQLGTDKDSIILDFFSGSSTTAHAVMKLNSEDNGNRKFIMVQLPEECEKDTVAYKNGFSNICDIGEERIIRAAKLIKEETNAIVDYGYRVFKVDTTNMKKVFYSPAETQQNLMDIFIDNIKEDRTPEDLLFQVMLDLGILLSSKIVETEIAGRKVFDVADGFLIACFDKGVTEETVKAIAEKKPYYAVFRDSSMANDSVATNFKQIFEVISPETERRVL